MTRQYPARRQDPPIQIGGTRGFSLGLNQLTHPSAIQDNELSEAQNVYYSQNGVLTKRPGSITRGSIRGSSTIINAVQAVYNIGGSDYLLRLSDDGVVQRYSFATDTWLDLPGSPTFSNVNTTILQAYGHVYFLNETDTMVKWNGSTWTTFTALSNPTSAPSIEKVSSGRVTAVSISAGGSGYAVDQLLTISTGDANATLLIKSVSGGAVTSVEITNGGTGYSVSTENATTVSPAGGTGCKIDISTVAGVGAVTYYYAYAWYNEVGNTIASSEASLSDMPEELDSETYVKVTLPTAPAGAVRTGIFRGTTAGDGVFLDSVPAYQTTYNDKGFAEPDVLYGLPDSNTTAGFHFKFATVYKDTLIGVTTELGDHTLVFSAGGDKFDSFGRSDGGGYYSWRQDDGDPINGMHTFAPSNEEALYVFKERKIGAFTFDEEGGAVRDVNLALGAVSHKSIHAAGNDLRFWSRDGAMSIGNEPNFATVVRTKVLSARADKIVQSITAADMGNIAGVYYKNISLWGIPLGNVGDGNTSVITYDERYVAWSEWVGLTPNIWCKFIDEYNQERLFFGDSQSGNVKEAWQGTSDDGNPITLRISTKQFDQNQPFRYKTFGRIYFVFGNIRGSGTQLILVEDGERSQLPLIISGDEGNIGFGVDQWGTIQFGDTSGKFSQSTSGLKVRYYDLSQKDLFSLQAILTNAGVNDQVEFMGFFFEWSESGQPLPASMKLKRA